MWIVGILLLLLRDTVVDDVIYFVKTEKSFGILLVIVGLVCLLIIVWLSRSSGSRERRGVSIWFFTVLFMLILHPIVMDTLYFAYQHGHRNDWKAVSAVIKQESEEGDIILSSIPAVASHYLPGQEVKDIHGIDLRSLLQNNQRVWYVQQTMAEVSTWETAQEWTSRNCGLVDSWDHFVAGRWWPMRLHKCEPEVSSFD